MFNFIINKIYENPIYQKYYKQLGVLIFSIIIITFCSTIIHLYHNCNLFYCLNEGKVICYNYLDKSIAHYYNNSTQECTFLDKQKCMYKWSCAYIFNSKYYYVKKNLKKKYIYNIYGGKYTYFIFIFCIIIFSSITIIDIAIIITLYYT